MALRAVKKIDQLTERHGLPKQLCELLDKYPRDSWGNNVLQGSWVSFWLGRHSVFREISRSIKQLIRELLDGNISKERFMQQYIQLTNMMLHNLDSHHTVEDNYIFPKFFDKSVKFRYGLELLENDHHLIHQSIDKLTSEGNNLITMLNEKKDVDLKLAVSNYNAVNENFDKLLMAHLYDEEDLLIPLVSQYGEEYFGLGH